MIIKLKGGLGNQMFQYAFGRAHSLESGSPLFLDLSHYTNQPNVPFSQSDTPRTYALAHFNIAAQIVDKNTPSHTTTRPSSTLGEIFKKLGTKIASKLCGEKLYTYDKRLVKKALEAAPDTVLEGFWQTEKYFSGEKIRNILLSDFSLKNPLSKEAAAMAQKISSSQQSVSIHIRRGDYASNQTTQTYHGLLDFEYYQKAFATLFEKVTVPASSFTLFVFSDDIVWVKEHFEKITSKIPGLSKAHIEFVSSPAIFAHEELLLMSLCRFHIIANSSFSWWGAWLDPHNDKIVIAPRRWITSKNINTKDATPPSWIRI